MAEEKEQTVQERVVANYIIGLEKQLEQLNGVASELVKDASDETLDRLQITRQTKE